MARTRPTVVHEDDLPLERWPDPARGDATWRTLLSADRTPSAGLTVGVAEIPPMRRAAPTRTHRHPPAEVYYVLAGEGVVTIDGEDHGVRPGSTLFIPGGARHGVRNTGTRALRLLYAFAVDSFDQVEYEFSDD